MKRTFIGLQYAPKGTTGGKVENKVTDTETLQQGTETEQQDEQGQDDLANLFAELGINEVKNEVEYTSPKLTEIDATIDKLETLLGKVVEVEAKRKVRMKIAETNLAREVEIKAIKEAIRIAEVEAKRSAIIELNRSQKPLIIAQYLANLAFHAIPIDERDKDENKAIKDASTAADKAYKDAAEVVENRLLSGVPSVQGSKVVASTGNGTGGNKTREIKELIAPMYATHTPAQIRAFIIKEKGYNDGTANAAIHSFECENSLNGKSPALLNK